MINEGRVNLISSYIIHPELADWADSREYFTYFGYPWDDPETIDLSPDIPKEFSKNIELNEDAVYGKASINAINE